ncbi:MAG: type I DNA topoisomerase [Dehalococcoidia bacterium]
MTTETNGTTDTTGTPRRRAATRARTPGTGRRLVIVESPAKARTISQYLGPDYMVESSIGHIRDLPSSAAQIPKEYKKEPWARLGVNVEANFEPLYVVPPDKAEQVKKLRALLKDADEVYLATDEDREGEAIAWHLLQVLKPRVPVRRMVFHEITRAAIEAAIASPREVDFDLVRAQEARRILDRLFGYEISPVLWKKVAPRLAAGRVQSVAVRLIVDRERARMRFHTASYWDVDATLATRERGDDTSVAAHLVELGGRRVASGRDFDPETGRLSGDNTRLLDEPAAGAVAGHLRTSTFMVAEVNERPFTQRPPAPFITSTIQQEAARKLRYTAQRTMQVAQRLYENGYITYMRTDSTNLSQQALDAARRQAASLYGEATVPAEPRRYASGKAAQEAHEAIRPAGDIFRTPESLRNELDADALRLYELVWKRTVASQMKDATGLRTQVRLTADAGAEGAAVFQTAGKVITFPGFLRAYVEGSDDPDAEIEDQERLLPPLRVGQELDPRTLEAKGHETQPPARWTEASLIRELEERGIGRPSTYASILQTVQDRGYVWKRGSALVPTFVAFAVVNLLEQHFPDLVDLGFTARMEERLDEIAEGERDPKAWLRTLYFGDPDAPPSEPLAHDGLHATIDRGWEAIDARAVSSVPIGTDTDGREIAVRVGRYGPYLQVGDSEERASLPDSIPPDEVTVEDAMRLLHEERLGDHLLGADPQTGEPVYLKTGRYGPYVQLGDDPPRGSKEKPRRASLWDDMTMESITLDDALMLLSFPKTLGKHPDSGEDVTVQDGPNGPYVRAGKESRSIEGGHFAMKTMTLDEAVKVLAQPRQFGRRVAQSVLSELGEHPDGKASITVRSGKFGPYVTDGVVNASLPKGRDPKSLTLEDALDLIAAREEKLRSEGQDPRAPKAAAKAAAKRAPARRTSKTARSASKTRRAS